ncbi:LANO_0D00760g1_1 [Lachancea nothofagi CBS 11611]|uniref:LANO_0D00760g1_1 n=1 Tax=Lachancea nothofagi CBS 11611 TaxID=1266666 RepID=A0A1G4JD78_9SACH|nr:LANO_0D00760g1_1 [Lachancea nothofagi CBS 11611]
MRSQSKLGDRISDLAQDYYTKLLSTSKPITRSNGIQEWTVLACVVAIDEKEDVLRLVSLATGVKATPDVELRRSHGKILHDCHAEILAIRGFNTVLMKQAMLLNSCNSPRDVDLINACSDGYKVKDSWAFALYVSRAPCGDASMDLLEDNDSAYFTAENLCQYVDPSVRTILRGRFNYKKKGYVRTKPGRKDSNVTLSKSCTDKLCCRQSVSLLNAMNWELFVEPVFLKYLVTPQVSDTLRNAFDRAFKTRVRDVPGLQVMELISCSKMFTGDKREATESPALLGGILLNVIPQNVPEQQCIINGVKNGSYVKSPKPLRKNCESLVSRAAQWSLFKRLRPQEHNITYCSFKNKQIGRNALKLKVRLALSRDGWVATKLDDCT